MEAQFARVLVAEDSPLNFELIRDLLEVHGHSVDWARDGQEALDKASTGDFDLLLVDLHMPRVDGFEVVRQIRANPPLRKLMVIALTADAMIGVREEMLAVGADGYLSKPLDLGALLAQIARLGPAPESTRVA